MLDEKTLNGIPASDLFVSDPLAIVLGQRLNDIKGDLEFALVQLSRNPARVSRSIEVALTHVKEAKDLLPLIKMKTPEDYALKGKTNNGTSRN